MVKPIFSTRHKVILLGSFMFLLSYFHRIIMSAAAPAIKADLGLDSVQLGWLFSIYTITYTLSQIPVSVISDRFGGRKVISLMVSFWSLFTVVTGLCHNFISLFFTRMLFGAAQAGGLPACTGALNKWVRPDERALVQGITHAFTRVGAAIAPPLAVAVILRWGWPAVFYGFGLLGFIWVVSWYYYFRDDPANHFRITSGELKDIYRGGRPAARTSIRSRRIPWGKVLRNKSVWFLALADFCYFYTFSIYMFWLPSYLVEARNFSILQMGFYAALPYLGGALGDLSGGWFSDYLLHRTGNVRLARRLVPMLAMFLSICFVLPAVRVDSSYWALALIILAFFFLDCTISVFWALAMDIGGDYAGVASSLMNTTGSLGGTISPVAFGFLVSRLNSWSAPFYLASLIMLVGIMFVFLINPEETLKY